MSAPLTGRYSQSTQSGDGIHISKAELIALEGRCRRRHLPAMRPARSALAGPHESRFRGRGVDYLESRIYLPGDDIRNMDWRVTARTGKAHTKVFQEERERPVIMVVDRNPGMFFATRGQLKTVMAAKIATAMAWTAARRGDRTGGVIYGGGVHHELRPRGGRRGVLRLIQQLERWCNPEPLPEQTDPLADSLKRLRNVIRPGSLVVIISDFYRLDDDCNRHISRLAQHNDLVGCQLLDPIEQAMPAGVFPITDGIQSTSLDTRSRKLKSRLQVRERQHQIAPADMFRKHGARWMQVLTTDDPLIVIERGLGINSRG
ncbi:MAG: DUF58 domain-containing protein [Xanthomonadales bacterium]|nr:DUF58 domain-containing protein [Xanthomonadales bacterium]